MTRPLVLLLGTWLALLLLFATWPGLDPAISALFYDHATQSFPLQQHERLATLRAVLWNGTYLVAAVVLVLGAQSVLSRRPSVIPGRFWAFAATYVVLGPIILVDQLLKDHWGRARPAETSLFGGECTIYASLADHRSVCGQLFVCLGRGSLHGGGGHFDRSCALVLAGAQRPPDLV